MRGSSLRFRWKRTEAIAFLVALLACVPPPKCRAADSYLNRSKAQEANPYGTTIEPSTSGATGATGADDAHHATQPRKDVTSTTVPPRSGPEGPGREAR